MMKMERLSTLSDISIKYKDTRDHYLSNAEETIQKKELRKASELLWGGITQAIKLLASLSNKFIYSHKDFENFVDAVGDELKDEKIYMEFMFLSILHQNFYEEKIPEKHFKTYYRKTYEFLEKIDKIIQIKLNEK